MFRSSCVVRTSANGHGVRWANGMRYTIPTLVVLTLLATGCVSKRKYVSATSTAERLRADSTAMANETKALNSQLYGLQDYAKLTTEELEQRQKELTATQAELKAKAQRMDELDRRLQAQNDAMNSLRKKVSDALVNFKAEDLTVSMKDGKVYVSLSEQLLFASGSAKVDPKGAEALGKLAEVLRANADINVMVEGHTDTIPIRTSNFKDNWDLSTARATSIVRLLTATYNVPSQRVQASGRGEFVPVATNATSEGRAKNRRTEIILVPKLDELFEMVGSGTAPTTTEPK
ncbi:MAG: OmpA family protein [Flavobacteriales bacterium]|nr:OmpA family protein [Flavobacteriales bacterium]